MLSSTLQDIFQCAHPAASREVHSTDLPQGPGQCEWCRHCGALRLTTDGHRDSMWRAPSGMLKAREQVLLEGLKVMEGGKKR